MKRIHTGLAILTILIALLAYRGNSQFFEFNTDYYKIVTSPPSSPSTVYKELVSTCEATAQYRHDEKRTGVAPTKDQPQAKARINKHFFPLNVDIHGASKASPTIDETGMYLGSDTGWFWKMDFKGEVIWSFYIPGSLNGIHGTAAVDDKKVYIGAYNGFMYALDKTDGSLVWTNPVADYIGASPLLAGGGLYIAAETPHPDGLVAKLDCNTGETQWVSEWLGGHSHSSPTFDKKTNTIMAGANSGRFFVFDADSGKTLWQKQFAGPIKGTPMVLEGTVYFGSWDKNYHAYDIKTGEERWSTFMGGRIQTSLTLVPGENLGVTNTKVGEIVGLSLLDGSIKWRLRHGDGNHQFSVLVTKDPQRKGEFIAWSRCKEFQLCSLDAKTGKLLQNLDLPGSFTSIPVAWDDQLYISLDKNQGMVILR